MEANAMEKDTTQIAIMCTDRQIAKVIASARYGAMPHAGSNEANHWQNQMIVWRTGKGSVALSAYYGGERRVRVLSI